MARLLSSMQKTDHDDEMRIQSGYVPLWMRIRVWQVPHSGARRERTNPFLPGTKGFLAD